jgi:hypothetical protein
MEKEAETKAITNWLWTTDKPLGRRKGNNNASGPREK